MNNISKEDIEFLSNLQNELLTQDDDCQAAPRFWVVAENKREYGFDDGYADGFIIVDPDGKGWEHPEELLEYLLDNDYLSEAQIDRECDYTMAEILDILDNSEFRICGYKYRRNVIAPDTMFLTKVACKKHIELNHYHYQEPHTYAMTAWRSPKVERLLKILTDTDWESVKYGNGN